MENILSAARTTTMGCETISMQNGINEFHQKTIWFTYGTGEQPKQNTIYKWVTECKRETMKIPAEDEFVFIVCYDKWQQWLSLITKLNPDLFIQSGSGHYT